MMRCDLIINSVLPVEVVNESRKIQLSPQLFKNGLCHGFGSEPTKLTCYGNFYYTVIKIVDLTKSLNKKRLGKVLGMILLVTFEVSASK